jgi:hypothetical protein
VVRILNDDGSPRQEQHSYGALEIALTIEFQDGRKVGEFYFSKHRMCSRTTYEKRRVAYPDMPAADTAAFDAGAGVRHAVAAERRAKQKSAKDHVRDPRRAARLDAFCAELMRRGITRDAVAWILSPKHTLGELSHRASRELISRLVAQGCATITACQIDIDERGLGNTGHLVVELPQEPRKRVAVLKTLARLAGARGYDGDPDDGQRYVYVKLD